MSSMRVVKTVSDSIVNHALKNYAMALQGSSELRRHARRARCKTSFRRQTCHKRERLTAIVRGNDEPRLQGLRATLPAHVPRLCGRAERRSPHGPARSTRTRPRWRRRARQRATLRRSRLGDRARARLPASGARFKWRQTSPTFSCGAAGAAAAAAATGRSRNIATGSPTTSGSCTPTSSRARSAAARSWSAGAAAVSIEIDDDFELRVPPCLCRRAAQCCRSPAASSVSAGSPRPTVAEPLDVRGDATSQPSPRSAGLVDFATHTARSVLLPLRGRRAHEPPTRPCAPPLLQRRRDGARR